MQPLSSLQPESLVAENQKNNHNMNRQASSKNTITIKSVGVDEREDSQDKQDGTPLQFKYSKWRYYYNYVKKPLLNYLINRYYIQN